MGIYMLNKRKYIFKKGLFMQNAPYTYRSQKFICTIMALATGLVGSANMLSAILPRPNWDMLLGAWPLDVHHGVHKLIVIAGFFLLMLSYGLVRGKRGAWRVSFVLLVVSTVLHILSSGQVLMTILTGALIALLATCSRSFKANSHPPSVQRGSIALIVGLGIVFRYTICGLFALYDQFEFVIDRFGFDDVFLRVFTTPHF